MIHIQNLEGTPLDLEEMEDLIPQFVSTMPELNAHEANNIVDAEIWLSQKKRKVADVLDVNFLLLLHKKMFSKTWKWAGKFRRSNKNIGCDKAYIVEELKLMVGDVRYWVEHKTFSVDESIARFHHRLVKIHPFPNGNGRHARMAADALALALGQSPFTWGSELRSQNSTKEQYIKALQAADREDYKPLLQFLGVQK